MLPFKFTYRKVELWLRQPFTISRGTKKSVTNVFVRLESEGIAGYGEAAPSTRYGENADKVIQFLENISGEFFDTINSPDHLVPSLDALASKSSAQSVQSAKSAVEMAWLDWWGKKQGKPLWKLWEAPSAKGPQTSFTIGLDDIEVMQHKVEAASGYPILKVKLGTDRDKEIITGIREVTDRPVRVDANEGWTTIEEAKTMIHFLADHNIELVEQPMPAGNLDGMAELRKFSPLPLCADESFMGHESLPDIARAFDIINIKLMKIGSMIKARQVIEKAKKLDLEVMIGCMIESSVANTGGAILSLWADYADLDGHLLIKDDPAEGLKLDSQKRIVLNEQPGLGIRITE